MKLKTAIISSVGIAIGALVLGIVLCLLFINPNASNANERASMIGQGIGTLCMFPLFVIWILWAARFRKERDEKNKQGK
jgi:cadmium resistance protein CadD (predicted permease)